MHPQHCLENTKMRGSTAGSPQIHFYMGFKRASLRLETMLASKRLRYRSGRIAVTVSCHASTRCRGTVRIVKGKTTIGTRSYSVKAGKRATVRLRPHSRGRAALMRSRKHRVTVRLRPRDGTIVSRKLTLRR